MSHHDIPTNHIKSLTYGLHRGTNDFSECSNVYLFGTYHLDGDMLTSLARAQTRQPEDDNAHQYTWQQLVDSQSASDIQQALSRGCCRNVVDVGGVTQAKPMTGFVALNSIELRGVVSHLRNCFPGIQILDFDTKAPLDESRFITIREMAMTYVRDYLEATEELSLKTSSLRRSLLASLGLKNVSDDLWKEILNISYSGWERTGNTLKRINLLEQPALD
jgi:hypothetical protein